MRIRRKPWVRQELEKCKFYIKVPSENKGKWHEAFEKKQPIHVELGCGKGKFLAEIASQNPNINYIGIDIKSEVLGVAKRNIEQVYLEKKKNVNNIFVMSQEILIIENMMNEKDVVDRIYINFCNPWPKPRHYKKRLTHINQLQKYKSFLGTKGEIYFKTDDESLFNASIKYFEQAGFTILKKTYDLNSEEEPNILTEHEEMFIKQGIKIKALIAKLNQ